MSTSAPLRVLAYCDSATYSGAESFFCRILGDLARLPGVDAAYGVPAGNGELRAAVRAAAGDSAELIDVPVQRLGVAAAHLFDPRRRRALRPVLDRGWDVILMNLSSPEYGGTPALMRPRARTVGVLHIDAPPRDAGSRLHRLRGLASRRALRRLDTLCVLSAGAADRARALWTGPDTEVTVVPMPRPDVRPEDPAASRAALGLPPAPVPIVGIAGRIDLRQKGHDTLAHAMARVREARPDVVWAIAGAGPDEPVLRRLTGELGLAEATVFLGAVRPVDPFLAAVDALAIPSRLEGIPLIAMEAVAAGVGGPASAIPGIRELWPPEWQVPPGDAEALAAALEAYLAGPAEAKVAPLAAARTRVAVLATDDYRPFLARTLGVAAA